MIEGLCTCPVCNGSLRVPCENDITRDYGLKYGWYGYDRETDTVPCNNCGGQTQFPGRPTGQVLPRKDNGDIPALGQRFAVEPVHQFGCLSK